MPVPDGQERSSRFPVLFTARSPGVYEPLRNGENRNLSPAKACARSRRSAHWPECTLSLKDPTRSGRQASRLVIAECAEGASCLGTERVALWNDIFLGNPEYVTGDTTCLAWSSGQ